MSVRSWLAELLTAELPADWTLRPGVGDVDVLEGPTIILWPAELSPGPQRGVRTHELRVRLMTEVQDDTEADDELDALLPVLLDVIERNDPLVWTAAERGIHAETFHAWTVTVRVPAKKEK